MSINPVLVALVTMVACSHVTYFAARHFKGPTNWNRLWLIAVFPCCLGFTGLAGFGYFNGVFTVASLCGLYFAVRADSLSSAVGLFIGAVFIGLTGCSMVFGLCNGDSYVPQAGQWDTKVRANKPTKTPLQAMSEIWLTVQEDATKPNPPVFSSGYLDDQRDLRLKKGPFVYIEPVRQWHSWFSGVYRARRHTFRIWTAGGAASVAATQAELVETDDQRVLLSTPIPADRQGLGDPGLTSWEDPLRNVYSSPLAY